MLQKALLEVKGIDGAELLFESAREAWRSTLAPLFAADPPVGNPCLVLERAFRDAGLGELQIRISPDGRSGRAVVADSFLAGSARDQVGCRIVAGLLSGGLAAWFGSDLEVTEECCSREAAGEVSCTFRLSRLEPAFAFETTSRSGVFEVTHSADAVALEPDFGRISRLPARFYDEVTSRFLSIVPARLGAKFANLPAIILTEIGHRTGYRAFGDLVLREDWRALFRRERDRDARLAALLPMLDRFQWGRWGVRSSSEGDRVILSVRGSYEAEGASELDAPGAEPRCHYLRGMAAALMNVVCIDPDEIIELGEPHYSRLFRSPMAYRAVETRCAAQGEPACEFLVSPMSPGTSIVSKLTTGTRRLNLRRL